jgi:hypothetical protein
VGVVGGDYRVIFLYDDGRRSHILRVFDVPLTQCVPADYEHERRERSAD